MYAREIHESPTGIVLRVGAYGEVPSTLEMTSGARQRWSNPPFLFNFVMDELMENALGGLQDRELGRSYAAQIGQMTLRLFACVEQVQRGLQGFVRTVAPFGMCFAPIKC